jgi:uncharacterized protein involved in exopolysaccharide biosynthesis
MNGYTPAKDWQMNPVEVPSEAKAFNVRDLLGIFVRRWPIVCGIPFLAVLVGMTIFISLTPRYTGTAAILIDPKTPGSIGPGTDFGTAIVVDSAKIASMTSIIQSSALLESVVESEKLYDDPEFGLVRPGRLARLLSMITGHASANDKDLDDAARKRLRIDAARERLQKATSVGREGLTYIIDVTVTSNDPVKAARLSEAISEAYLNDQLHVKNEAAHHATSWLAGRLTEMRKEVMLLRFGGLMD